MMDSPEIIDLRERASTTVEDPYRINVLAVQNALGSASNNLARALAEGRIPPNERVSAKAAEIVLGALATAIAEGLMAATHEARRERASGKLNG